jgi:RNA polymerase sigma-70 factor (ECF subfamily)
MRGGNNKWTAQTADGRLIAAYQEGDQCAFDVLFKKHLHRILGICANILDREEDCKDAAMDIYVVLRRELLRYEIQQFEGWLYTLVRNYCLKLIRERKQQQQMETLDGPWAAFLRENNNLQQQQQDEELLRNLKKAIQELKPDQKECISLFYLDGHSYKEIAKLTGLSLNKVKSNIQNGKRNIRIAMAT